jgi:hypothetical protein
LAFLTIAGLIALVLVILLIVRLVKHSWKAITGLALVVSLAVPAVALVMGYNNFKAVAHSSVNTGINTQLEQKYGMDYTQKVQQKIDDTYNDLTPSQQSKVEQETGMTLDQINQKIDDGSYLELANKLKDSGLADDFDIDSKLQAYGIDPNSPLVQSVLNGN